MDRHTTGMWVIGPYREDRHNGGEKIEIRAEGRTETPYRVVVAEVWQGRADAILIACAPDLLEALEDIARGPLQGPPNFAAYAQNRAKAAVTAVRGEG